MEEPSLPVETSLQHDGVDVRVEPGEAGLSSSRARSK